MRQRWIRCVFVLMATALFGTASALAANGEAVKQSGDISYVSGGVGDESLERVGALEMGFNVKLVFALQNGEYLSDVKVVIADAVGKPLLEAVAEGPVFLAKLPAGRYELRATVGDVTRMQRLRVGAKEGLKTVQFRWPPAP